MWLKKGSITLVLKGGLGNQLFQFVAALYYSQMSNIKRINLYTYNLNSFKAKREFKLLPFININEVELAVLDDKKFFFNEKILKGISFISNKVITDKSFFQNFNYSSYLLNGYFQSNIYLKSNFIQQIRDSFEKYLQKEFIDFFKNFEIKKLILELKSEDCLSIHIRGGDFLKNASFCSKFR